MEKNAATGEASRYLSSETRNRLSDSVPGPDYYILSDDGEFLYDVYYECTEQVSRVTIVRYKKRGILGGRLSCIIREKKKMGSGHGRAYKRSTAREGDENEPNALRPGKWADSEILTILRDRSRTPDEIIYWYPAGYFVYDFGFCAGGSGKILCHGPGTKNRRNLDRLFLKNCFFDFPLRAVCYRVYMFFFFWFFLDRRL